MSSEGFEGTVEAVNVDEAIDQLRTLYSINVSEIEEIV